MFKKTLVFGTETMGKKIQEERLLDLQQRLDLLPIRVAYQKAKDACGSFY